MADVYPPNYDTPIGEVRNIINDTERYVDPADTTATATYMFSDARLQAFLALNRDTVRYAAADALDAIASNEALISKKIRTEDLSTDGPAVAKELRVHAKSLRDAQADEDIALSYAEAFEIVDYVHYPSRWNLR